MSGAPRLSHVALPRECDTRQTPFGSATGAISGETGNATAPGKPASMRDLARDTLTRQQRDKVAARLATTLRDSINRCCDARGDDEHNRAALIAECMRLPPSGQADMHEHFEQEAARWERVARGQLACADPYRVGQGGVAAGVGVVFKERWGPTHKIALKFTCEPSELSGETFTKS